MGEEWARVVVVLIMRLLRCLRWGDRRGDCCRVREGWFCGEMLGELTWILQSSTIGKVGWTLMEYGDVVGF